MTKASFTGPVLGGHKHAAIEVPFDPANQWGVAAAPLWKGRRGYRVQGSLADLPFQGVVVPRAKRFWVLVDDEQLKAAGVSIGDSVRVSLEPLESS